MHVFTIASRLALVASASANLTFARRDNSTNATCVQQGDAENIVASFMTIMEHTNMTLANQTAQDLLTDGFFETSDSINTLSGAALGSTSFPTKADYVAAILSAPAPRNITTLNVMPAGCTNILWQWRMTVGLNAAPVQGFNLMMIDNNKLAGQYVEFNSIAWGVDIGYIVTNRGGQKFPLPGQVAGAVTSPATKSAATTLSASSLLYLSMAMILAVWAFSQ